MEQWDILVLIQLVPIPLLFNKFIILLRVERFVTLPLPHRPVRADFPHTVPLKSVSLVDDYDKVLV